MQSQDLVFLGILLFYHYFEKTEHFSVEGLSFFIDPDGPYGMDQKLIDRFLVSEGFTEYVGEKEKRAWKKLIAQLQTPSEC